MTEIEKNTNIFIKIWKVISTPLMFVAVQYIVVYIGAFIFGVYIGIQEELTGEILFNEEGVTNFFSEYSLIFVLISGLVCLGIIRWKFAKDRKRIKRMERETEKINLFLVAGISICAYVTLLIPQFFIDLANYLPGAEDSVNMIMTGGLRLQILAVVLVGPIVEEVVFRGIVFNRLKEYKVTLWVAIIIQAILFGIIHFNAFQGLYAMLVGILFAIIYHKTKTLWAPIIAHMSYNATSLAFLYFGGYVTILLPALILPILMYILFAKYKPSESITENLEEIEEGNLR